MFKAIKEFFVGKPAEAIPTPVPYKVESQPVVVTAPKVVAPVVTTTVADGTAAQPTHGLEPFADGVTITMIDTAPAAVVVPISVTDVTPKPKARKAPAPKAVKEKAPAKAKAPKLTVVKTPAKAKSKKA